MKTTYQIDDGKVIETIISDDSYNDLMALPDERRPEFLDEKDKRVIAYLKQKDSAK